MGDGRTGASDGGSGHQVRGGRVDGRVASWFGQLCPDTVQQEVPAAKPGPPPAAPEKPAKLEPLSEARYKVVFTASEELRDKLERVEAKRYGKTNKPRDNVEDADTSPGVRGIAAAVKRAVWERDRGQCTFVTTEGKRCPERHRLLSHPQLSLTSLGWPPAFRT